MHARFLPARVAYSRRERWAVAFAMLLLGAFLFVDVHPLPILLWDESRNVVNALEMGRAGFGLVTTYDGQPDLWNAKPPLVVWLMVASMRVFGASEWALRLPSMVATIATLLIVIAFVRRVTGSIATALFAAVLIAFSPASFGEHSGRTADYDAVTVACTTGYLALLFFALHRARPRVRTLVGIAVAGSGAVLAKDVAGVVPALGVLVYLALVARTPRLWRVAPPALVAAGAFVAFLLAREAAAPGYVAALWSNDVGGRFAHSLIGREKSRLYYAGLLWDGYFAATPLLLCAPVAFAWGRARERLALLYALCVAAGVLIVVTFAASKLNHYVLPAIPFLAIAAALTLRVLLRRLYAAHRNGDRMVRLLAIALLAFGALPLARAGWAGVVRRHLTDPPYEGAASGHYRTLLAAVVPLGAPVTVVDPGFVNDGVAHYTPVLRAYRLLWAARGVAITQTVDASAVARRHGIVASCHLATAPLLRGRGHEIGGTPGCVAIRR